MEEEGMAKPSFPERVETERLLLRRYDGEDAAGILDLVYSDRDKLIREFSRLAGLQDLQEAQQFVQDKREQWKAEKTFCYGIWRKEAPEQIGQIQVKNIAWDVPSAELGYFICTARQRQGYASESMRAISRLAFLELEFQRIFVRILPSNRESIHLARKLGFHEVGVQRKAFRCGPGNCMTCSICPGPPRTTAITTAAQRDKTTNRIAYHPPH